MIEILQTEITVDPLARGYAGMSDADVAVDLNTVYRTQNKSTMTSSEVYNAIDSTEWLALTDVQRAEIWDILHLGTINPFGFEATRLTAIFPGGGDTITTLAADRKTNVSRATELGIGTVKEGHVQEARA